MLMLQVPTTPGGEGLGDLSALASPKSSEGPRQAWALTFPTVQVSLVKVPGLSSHLPLRHLSPHHLLTEGPKSTTPGLTFTPSTCPFISNDLLNMPT